MPDTIVTIDHTWAPRQFIPGGSANRYIDTRMRQALVYAKFLTPARTGKLRDHNKKTGTLNQGLLGAVCSIYNDLDYSWFVHEGTLGAVIVPLGPRAMPIPVAPKGLPYRVTGPVNGAFIHRRRVRGQRPQMFLSLAVGRAFQDIL